MSLDRISGERLDGHRETRLDDFGRRRQNEARYQTGNGEGLPQAKETRRPDERKHRELTSPRPHAGQDCRHGMTRASTIARTLVVAAPKTATVIIPTAI